MKLFEILKNTIIFLLTLSLITSYHVEAEEAVVQLSPKEAHQKLLIESFTKLFWDSKKIKESKFAGQKPVELNADLVKFWKGNDPTIDMGLERVELVFLQGKGEGSKNLFHINIDLSRRQELFFHSETTLPKFRGGAILELTKPTEVRTFYFPGANGTGMLIMAPALKGQEDFYFMACPRELKIKGEALLGLHNTDVKLYSALFLPHGRIKAFLLTGMTSGTIDGAFERTAQIPPGVEPQDFVQGNNPVLDLLYRAETDYVAPPITESSHESQYFSAELEMILPSGYKRKISDGFDISVKTLNIPEMEVVIPIAIVSNTSSRSVVTEKLNRGKGKNGIRTIVDSGPCTMVTSERRMKKVELTAQ